MVRNSDLLVVVWAGGAARAAVALPRSLAFAHALDDQFGGLMRTTSRGLRLFTATSRLRGQEAAIASEAALSAFEAGAWG